MLTTPFGEIKVYIDGAPADYEATVHYYDRPPVKGHPIAGCYRIHVPVGEYRSIRCEVEQNNTNIVNTGASGERYMDAEFISDSIILTIGAEDENPVFETVRTASGMEYRIHGPVPEVVFGIAWAIDYDGADDVRTWYAADPTLDGGISMGIFKIKAGEFEWIGGAKDDPQDLCLHGRVTVQFGDTVLEDNGTVSATALYLLKTLTEDKVMAYHDIQMIPCCGHFLMPNKELTEVEISGCDTGTDWSTIHEGNTVRLILPSGQEEVVSLRDYQYAVLDFAKSVKRFYDSCTPKKVPEDEFQRNGYAAFWNEWRRRYNEGLMLLSLETGREMELSHDGLHYFISHKDGEWSLYCEETRVMQLFPSWNALYENARLGDRLLRDEISNLNFDAIL